MRGFGWGFIGGLRCVRHCAEAGRELMEVQVLGAPCFVISAALFCLEVQDKWWKPEPKSIGWQMCVLFLPP